MSQRFYAAIQLPKVFEIPDFLIGKLLVSTISIERLIFIGNVTGIENESHYPLASFTGLYVIEVMSCQKTYIFRNK